jgi:hypothetical protein
VLVAAGRGRAVRAGGWVILDLGHASGTFRLAGLC